MWTHQMAVGVGWWFCIVSWYVISYTFIYFDLELLCYVNTEVFCIELKSSAVFSGERVGDGYIEELWYILCGTAG